LDGDESFLDYVSAGISGKVFVAKSKISFTIAEAPDG